MHIVRAKERSIVETIRHQALIERKCILLRWSLLILTVCMLIEQLRRCTGLTLIEGLGRCTDAVLSFHEVCYNRRSPIQLQASSDRRPVRTLIEWDQFEESRIKKLPTYTSEWFHSVSNIKTQEPS